MRTSLCRLGIIAAIASCNGQSDSGVVIFQDASTILQLPESAERVESVPLEVRAGDTLRVEAVVGSIEATVGDEPSLKAVFSMKARTKEEAKGVLDTYKVKVERDGSRVLVTITGEPLVIAEKHLSMTTRPSCELTLRVPAGVTFEAKTTGAVSAEGAFAGCVIDTRYGAIRLSGIRGGANAKTNNGDVTVSNLEAGGDAVQLESRYGDISLSRAKCTTVKIDTNNGDVRCVDVETTSSRVRSRYGDLEFGNVTGPIDAGTSNGDIDLDAPGSAVRVLKTRYGKIRVRRSAGDLDVATNNGRIQVDAHHGALRAHSFYGKLTLTGDFSGLDALSRNGTVEVRAGSGSKVSSAWSIRSGHGDVALHIPSTFACAFKATTKHGRIRVGVPFETQVPFDSGGDTRQVEGRIGSGGNSVSLETGNGDIRIEKGS
ncbi:MAG: DUF4097 family beta strand repeat-containing protein [Planctomycetota bacterium]